MLAVTDRGGPKGCRPSSGASAARNRSSRLRASDDAGPEADAVPAPRPSCRPRLLPRGLEPGLLGSACAVPGAAARVRAVRRATRGNLCRRHLVSPGVQGGSAPPLSAARRLRAQRRSLAPLRCVSERRRHERARPVRDRPRRHHPVELRVPRQASAADRGADGILRALEELPPRERPGKRHSPCP